LRPRELPSVTDRSTKVKRKRRGRREEERGQRKEGRGKRAEERGQRKEGRGKRAEERGQRREERGERREERGERREDRGNEAERARREGYGQLIWRLKAPSSLGVYESTTMM
jgi:hypothetical protein